MMKRKHKIIAAAERLRRQFGLGDVPISETTLRVLLENSGYFLYYYPFGRSSVSGASARYGDFSFVVVNSSQSLGRQNFTLVHEVAHLELHLGLKGKVAEDDEVEMEADFFAANFWVPESALIRVVPEECADKRVFDAITVIRLSQIFRVSYSHMVKRIYEVFGRGSEVEEINDERIIHLAESLGLDASLYKPTEEVYFARTPTLTVVKKAYRKGLIEKRDAAKLLTEAGFDLNELNRLQFA